MDLHICQIKDNQHYLTEEELTAATAVGPAATAAGLTYSTRLESSSETYLKKRHLVKQLRDQPFNQKVFFIAEVGPGIA